MTTMSYALDRQAKWFLFGTALLLSLVFIVAFPGVAKADVAGDFKFTITSEVDVAPVASAKIEIQCTGGVMVNIGTTSVTGTLFATPAAGSSCGAGDSITGYAVGRGGFVTYTTLPPNVYQTTDLNAVTTTNMRYQVKVTLTDQVGTAVTSTGTFTYNGAAASTTSATAMFFGTTGTNAILSVKKDGYVNATTTNSGLTDVTTASTSQLAITFASSSAASSAITSTSTVRGLLFSHRIKVSREVDVKMLSGGTVTAAGVTCSEESSNTGTYFCSILVANDGGSGDVIVALDGFVTDNNTLNTGNRVNGDDAQQTQSLTTIAFSHKVVVTDQLGTALTPDTVTAGANDVSCIISSNSAYCPVLLADDDTIGQGFDINKNGYVSTTVALASNRTTSTTIQRVVTLTSANGVSFGNVITLLSGATPATGVTVTAGDSLGTTCTESGTTGIYYCAIPEANTSLVAQFVKSGFTTRTNSFSSDRSASTSAQVAMTYNQFLAAGSGSNVSAVTKPVITSITLGDGSGTTATKDIKITFVGSNILRYKIALTQAGLATEEYPQYPGTAIPYTLSVGDGVKTLWFRFMSNTGDESSDSSKQITLSAATATPATPAVPAVPAVPATPPKVSVPVVLLIDLPRVPTVITPITAKPMAPDFTPVSIAALADGDLFMIEDAFAGASVYWFTGGYKRPFASEKAFMSWFPSFDRVSIKRVKKNEITYLAWGPAMPYKPGSKLIKVPDDAKTYSIQADGSLCHVKDEVDAAKLFGANWNKRVDDMPVSQLLGTYKIKDACVVAS